MSDSLHLSGPMKKNDELFVKLASGPFPAVHVYCQAGIEVVHGPSCIRVEREVDVAACMRDNVPVRPRRGGGGTVVLSPGMVVTVIVGLRRNSENACGIFSHIHTALAELIREHAGIILEPRGISDLAVGPLKVLGSSLYLPSRPLLYCYQSSLMVESDLRLLERYLKHPPREPDYRAGREHGQFCTSLHTCGCRLTTKQIADIFSSGLSALVTR